MKVLIRTEADHDLDGIYEWIAKDNPRAALDATTGFAEIAAGAAERWARASSSSSHTSSSMRATRKETLVVLGILSWRHESSSSAAASPRNRACARGLPVYARR
jgi:hypothetical protein